MSEEERLKSIQRRRFVRKCLVFSFYSLMILMTLGAGFAYWAFGGYMKPSLDPQYLPTAEYLLQHSVQERTAGGWNDEIRFGLSKFSDNQVCLEVTLIPENGFPNWRWVEIFINEQILGRFHPGWTDLVFYDGFGGDNPPCIPGHLDNGLHILEFRMKDSLFAEPYYIRRLAIEMP